MYMLRVLDIRPQQFGTRKAQVVLWSGTPRQPVIATAPNGRFLAYISNQSGWNNLYLYDFEAHTHRALTTEPVDCGQPAWLQGMCTYGFRYDGQGLKYGEVKTVTKEIASLPFTFDVQVGGNTPPKMISLERSLKAK